SLLGVCCGGEVVEVVGVVGKWWSGLEKREMVENVLAGKEVTGATVLSF
nr:hypothetical protein [Tanacetum cinerariifolium]